MNAKDLEEKLTNASAVNRANIINAAAANVCSTDYLNFERPLYEEKNQKRDKSDKQIPHWLRRQIGKVTSKDKASNREWVIEKVRCITAANILRESNVGRFFFFNNIS